MRGNVKGVVRDGHIESKDFEVLIGPTGMQSEIRFGGIKVTNCKSMTIKIQADLPTLVDLDLMIEEKK